MPEKLVTLDLSHMRRLREALEEEVAFESWDGSRAPEGIIKSLASVRPSFRAGYRNLDHKNSMASQPQALPSATLPSFLAPRPSVPFLFCPPGQLSCGKQSEWAVHTGPGGD